jgi:conjugal transfer pilus assembly protein TraB
MKIEVMAAKTKADEADKKTSALQAQVTLLLSKNAGTLTPGTPDAPVNLSAPLPLAPPAPVEFNQVDNSKSISPIKKDEVNRGIGTWSSKENSDSASKKDTLTITIPALSALDAVLLTGFNARTISGGGTTGGSIVSANNVGAPFVTRVKGSAILPNGWRAADLSDCFISGTAIGVLSTERANAIADRISCIDVKGRIFEAKIKGYGVDLDGVQGLSGNLVTKQGAILAKVALAGIASGLGASFTPQTSTAFSNTSAAGGSTPYTMPNSSLMAGNAMGQGLNQSMAQLSKFYLDFAKNMFPVLEVTSGTRMTWILQESVELTAMKENASINK